MTNPKVARGALGEFSAFRGVSLLFDNPGGGLVPSPSGPPLLEVDLKDDRNRLYRLLHAALAQQAHVAEMMEKYTYRPVPAATSHVTVADLINDGNVRGLAPPAYYQFNTILEELPASLTDSSLNQFRITVPLNKQTERHELALAFGRLHVFRERSALVALLRPADEASSVVMDGIEIQRTQLNNALTALGLKPQEAWFPHLTLGYFAADYYLDAVERAVPSWSERVLAATPELLAKVADAEITFAGVGLYGFSSMSEFFRLPSDVTASA